MSRLLVYRSLARYDALGCFADQLVAALRALGHEVQLLTFAGEDLLARLTEALGRRPDALLAFNGLGVELEALNDRLYSRLGVPYLGINVDHPLYLLDRLAAPIARHLATFVDHTHVDFAARFLPTVRPSFLAHAAQPPSGPAPLQRDLAVLFAGSYEDPEPLAAQWRGLRPQTAELFEDVARRCLAQPGRGLFEHFEDAYRQRALPAEVMNQHQVLALLNLPDRYVRACWRKQMLEAFDGAGITVDVFGHNWQAFASRGRHRFHDPVNFDALTGLLQRANVVLATGANFPTGSHERVLTAMACGAAVLSDHTAFYGDAFTLGRDLLTYPQGRFADVAETVRGLLQDPDRLHEIQRCAPRAVARAHTWKARAETLMQLLA